MNGKRLLSGAAIALAMVISGSTFAGSNMGPLGETMARGQAVESVAAPTHRDAAGNGPVAVAAAGKTMNLPPVASIRRGSDIRPFLHPDVPGEVRTAALRRAWSTDPAIRDFVGMTEDLP